MNARAGRRVWPWVLLLASGQVAALDEMPREGGWTGYLLAGPGGGAIRSNEIAGSAFKEIGDAEIDALDEHAGLERELVPVVTGELGYYFEATGTHVVLGNTLEDLVRYDFSTTLGVRQRMRPLGTLAVELLGSASPARVYRDPFLTGSERATVDRIATGARVIWDRIGGTGLEVELTGRVLALDSERSGAALGLDRTRRRALDREGRQGQVRAGFKLPVHPRHLLTPRVGWTRFDLEGEAVANDRLSLELAWQYMSRHALVTTELTLARSAFDAKHPVFGERREDDLMGLMISGLFPTILHSMRWALAGTLGVFDGDSSIEFYDTRVTVASVAIMFRL